MNLRQFENSVHLHINKCKKIYSDGIYVFPNNFFWHFPFLSGLGAYLLRIQIYCCKANNTTAVINAKSQEVFPFIFS